MYYVSITNRITDSYFINNHIKIYNVLLFYGIITNYIIYHIEIR